MYNLSKDISLTVEQKAENRKKWYVFFRHNIHRFIEMYFGIKLYPYQWIDMYAMGNSVKYVGIKSRGTAKTWQAGVFACAYATLYPNSQIVIVAETKKQAGIIIDKKIRPLIEQYVNLGREVKRVRANNNDWEIEMWNGSTIFVVALKESARGNRASMIIYEEFRRLDKDRRDAIIAPFKQPRVTPYMGKPQYKHLVEEAREIYITSSGRDSEEWWKDIEPIIKQSVKGRSASVLFADYIIAIKYGLKTQRDVYDDRERMGDETFSMEYENVLVRENKDAFFTPSLFANCRVLKTAYYPQHYAKYKMGKNPLAPKLRDGEKIILSVDIALKAGEKNDNTVIFVDRLIPTKNGYTHNQIYTEIMRGKNTLIQALRIKQIWYDLGASYIVLDTNGNGQGVYDSLTEVTIDNSRGLEYPPLTTMFHPTISKYKDYKNRTIGLDALPIIYPMVATDTINSECAYLVRDLIRSDMIKLMCQPNEGEDFLLDKAKYFDINTDLDYLQWFLMPYYQASELQAEMCSLKPSYTSSLVKLNEPTNGRKDRYTALAYDCYFVKKVLDPLIVKEVEKVDYSKQAVVMGNNAQNKTGLFGGRKELFGGRSSRKLFGR